MMLRRFALFAVGILFLFPISPVWAATLAQTLSGKILLDVESHGEAWYVYPVNTNRYYLKDGPAAYEMMRSFGLGITDANLAKIPSVSSVDAMKSAANSCGNSLAKSVKGRILLQVQQHGEAWYVDPSKCTRVYMKDGEAAYTIMRYLSLGITTANLELVPIGAGSALPPLPEGEQFVTRTIVTSEGSFVIRLAVLPRSDFEMITDTAVSSDCEDDCATKSLKDYVIENNAFAGIHGSYFCPPDYADCAQKTGSFDSPVYNSELGKIINGDEIAWYDKPMLAELSNGSLKYFHDGSSYRGEALSAAIGNWPSLVENGKSVIANEPTESSFATKGTRGGIGYDEENFYLVIASSASVPNLASIFMSLGADYAMNLDGGGSAALYYDGAYKFGPGRLLPNAIVFKRK
jgi:hypothetical protein